MITSEAMRFETMPQAYAGVLREILDRGHYVSPRGMLTKELIGTSLTLTAPLYNVVTQASRKVSLPFMAAEFMWMMTGTNDARLIVPYNKNIEQFSDDGLYFRGAYGPKLVDQLPYVIQTLKDDPESRQALLTIWRERPGLSKDIPCTVLMQFFIRTGLLDMLVYMRSNDAWLGMPYDVFNFTMIQQYVASLLDVDIGFYHHHVGSLHLYEKHWKKAQLVVEEGFGPVVHHDHLSAPMPPEVLTTFTGVSLLAEARGISPRDVYDWVDLSGVVKYQTWNDLLSLCAYRFHQDPRLIPKQYQELISYWDMYLDKKAEEDAAELGG